MANPNINIGVINESSVASQTQVGKILFTEQGNQYIIKSDGSKLKISDIIVVDTLPSTNIQSHKIYILSTQNYSMNYYDGSAWHILGGSSDSQISIGTTPPTDTNKLLIDITDKTKPILKWYDSTTTSWINISSTQIQSDWNQTDNSKADFIKNKPSGSNATSINNILVDDTTRTNGTGLFYNSGTGKYENATVNIAGIVGSSQITKAGENVTIASGSEVIFNHIASENIVPSIEEQIAGSSVTDTHVDFSDSSKYTLQDSGKILVGNNKSELDIYTKLLMHMDDSNFTDVCGHTVTNNGVTLDTSIKKFGTGSAKFNGTSSYLSLPTSIDWNLGNRDFEIKANVTLNSIASTGTLCGIWNSNKYSFIIQFSSNGLSFVVTTDGTGSTVTNYTATYTWAVGENYHIAIERYSNNLYMFVNGVLISTYSITKTIYASTSPLDIGRSTDSGGLAYLNGNIDEFILKKGKASNITSFSPPTSISPIPYLTSNIPTYLKTTGTSNFSLTTIDTITSLTIPVTLPSANTTCKCLVSLDNGINWLYRSSGILYKYTGDLTTSWTSSNLNTDLQTYFSNINLNTLTNDLSSLGITPISLNFAFQLSTSDLAQTPSVSAITMVYVNKSHNEFASFGSYSDSYSMYGVKRINSSSIGVKNKSAVTKVIKVNLVTSI